MADLAHALSFAAVAGAIRAVLDGRIWAGHNVAAFDLRVLREHFAAIEEEMPQAAGVVDTLPLLRAHFGKVRGADATSRPFRRAYLSCPVMFTYRRRRRR